MTLIQNSMIVSSRYVSGTVAFLLAMATVATQPLAFRFGNQLQALAYVCVGISYVGLLGVRRVCTPSH